MGCTLQTELPYFWKKLAERLAHKAPSNIGDIFSNCAQVIELDFLASTVEDMMLLVGDTQIQQVLTQQGGRATWKNLIELIVGSKFKLSTLPAAERHGSAWAKIRCTI